MYIVVMYVQGGHTVSILLTDVYSSNVQGGRTVVILLTDVHST